MMNAIEIFFIIRRAPIFLIAGREKSLSNSQSSLKGGNELDSMMWHQYAALETSSSSSSGTGVLFESSILVYSKLRFWPTITSRFP